MLVDWNTWTSGAAMTQLSTWTSTLHCPELQFTPALGGANVAQPSSTAQTKPVQIERFVAMLFSRCSELRRA